MKRRTMSIADLKGNLGFDWRPVDARHAEDDDGEPLPVVNIDLICEWRLPDGKVMFVEVPYETDEELVDIIAALQASVESFAKALTENFTKLADKE